jgi:hypothetical protein
VGSQDGCAQPLPTPGALTGPTSLAPVAIWLDVSWLKIPDTRPEFSDSFLKGANDHKLGNNDEVITVVIRNRSLDREFKSAWGLGRR